MTGDLTPSPTVPPARRPGGTERLASLDTLRGLIIVLMALDHARAFIARNHPAEFWGSSLPDYQGDWLAFLTRLVTHLCAPGFMFLMGAGAALFAASRARDGWRPVRITGHLALRGLLLIAMGQLLENTASSFAFAGGARIEVYGLRLPGVPGAIPIVLGVLYGLGASLAIAALLLRLPPLALAGLAGLCVIATHGLTPPASAIGAPIHPLLGLLVLPGFASPILCVYPIMPWLAPTLFGVAFGRVLVRDRTAAFRWIAPIGAACLVLFVALRASGGAGSFQPIGPGWIGFLNVTKYPPSFTFLLLTLGTNFVLLGVLERSSAARLPWTAPLRVFGSVPLFFFVAHLWLYAAMGRFLVAGTTIPGMYPYWLLGLVLLYLPCRWYAGIKQGQRSSSLLRLL